jgi:multiple sugar transport system permease protein
MAYSIFNIVPFLWMVSASFKRPEDVLTIPIEWIPPVWQPGNYTQALFEPRALC